MEIKKKTTDFSVSRPGIVTALMIALTLLLAASAALPSVWPRKFPFLHSLKIDTDPENMLPEHEPVRVFHDKMKKEMALYDMVVLGVVNEKHPNGVFNPKSLKRIYELTEFARDLQWFEYDGRSYISVNHAYHSVKSGEFDERVYADFLDTETRDQFERPDDENDLFNKIKKEGQLRGVIEKDIIAPSMVDSIEHQSGMIKFEWLMRAPPETEEEALAIREKAMRIPFLDGTLVSEDGKALAIYLPLTSKDVSYQVYDKLNGRIDEFEGDDHFYITGLPVAEDTFGVQMFKQMAMSAPVAMLIIFLLMLYFFRKLVLIISPMIVAMVSVICTMGMLIATGNTVHIMSSMIPIFIVPIAVLDAVHILSDFFDRYPETRDRKKTVSEVMDTLFTPMLYTSLTTAVGFASLALTPIPPVQVFGIFIAFGVMVAWLATILFIPAYVMFIPASWLENFGHDHASEEGSKTLMSRLLHATGLMTHRYSRLIIILMLAVIAVAVYGMSLINVNDNPINWFEKKHPIRVADRVLNKHFGGTYMAYLSFTAEAETDVDETFVKQFREASEKTAEQLKEGGYKKAETVFEILNKEISTASSTAQTRIAFFNQLIEMTRTKEQAAGDDFEAADAWKEAQLFLEKEQLRSHVFKSPEALKYIAQVQEHLMSTGVVGKSNSLADIVKTVYRDLVSGKEKDFRVPDSASGVASCLMQYQNSHRPGDLWHLVTPDYKKTVVWVQLKEGDNSAMEKVVDSLNTFIEKNPPSLSMKAEWFGLTYINVIWQNKMVKGMLNAFLGSFLMVFLMMTLLYRSALWGFLCMIPLTVTIAVIYGVIGLVGKDYDMPVAVLSSLSLGLAVDYAIHFLSRSRQIRTQTGTWKEAVAPVFGEPARAISRNVIVVGVGFLPLILAPLVPYQTVGIFIAAILVTAGVASLLILPAMISIMEKWLFPETAGRKLTCKCGTCIFSTIAIVALVVINVAHIEHANQWTWLSIPLIVVLAAACCIMSRRKGCSEL
mgnify:CR=1 FL=1